MSKRGSNEVFSGRTASMGMPSRNVMKDDFGLEIVDRVPIEFDANHINKNYLSTKRDKASRSKKTHIKH